MKTEELEEKLKKKSSDTLIIRCEMRKESDIEGPTFVNVAAKTTIDFDKFSFIWNVDFEASSTVLMSKVFSDMKDSKFQVVVKAPKDDVLIEISRIGKKMNRINKVKCQIFFLKHYITEILSSFDFFFFDRKSTGKNFWFFPPFLKKSALKDPRNEACQLKLNFFVSNGSTIEKPIKDRDNIQPSLSLKAFDIPSNDSLRDDFQALLANNKFSDVKLRVGDEVICVHKIILATRSPVFSVMFEQDMVENQTGEIDISDMNADTMHLFLKFIYTGILGELDNNTALELLLASEKYQVPSLKEECCCFLKERLNHDDICDILSVTDMVGHETLKNTAIHYIQKHAAKILGSPKWPQWIKKNPELGSEILCKFSDIIKAAS